jgi:hypothetical protein
MAPLGGSIFPNRDIDPRRRAEVDRFFATSPGRPSYEGPADDTIKRRVGYFTECFLDAFRRPYEAMVVALSPNERVVPNWRIKRYLFDQVPLKAAARSIKISQTPDAMVLSGESTFIGHVLPGATILPDPGPEFATIHGYAGQALKAIGLGAFCPQIFLTPFSSLPPFGSVGFADSDFGNAMSLIAPTRPAAGSGQLRTGFEVSGARVASAVTNGRFQAAVRDGASVDVTLGDNAACSVAITFADRAGTVLPALRGYVGRVVVEGNGVASVSFERTGEPATTRPAATLESVVLATAARFGVLRVEGDRATRDKQAASLTGRIGASSRADPTVGLHTAYAFEEADLIEHIAPIRSAIAAALLGVDLFDIGMLVRSPRGDQTFPFCPMLTRGWSLLEVKGVTLAPEVAAVRHELKQSLWTTFNPPGMRKINDALGAGRLT